MERQNKWGEDFVKLFKTGLVGLLALMMLVGCGNASDGAVQETDEGAPTTEVETGDSTEEVETDESTEEQALSADDVLQKSTEVMAELNGYSMEMTANQEITMDGEDPLNIVTSTKTDMTLNPLAMYQVTVIEDADSLLGSMESETYFSSEGFFVFDAMVGQWFKLPSEFVAELSALSEMQQNPAEQLELLKAFSSEIVLKEESDVYILNIEGSGDQYNEMLSMFGGMMGDEMGAMMEEMFSLMTINQLSYEIHIDKETYYQTRMVVLMDMEMDLDGEKMVSVQTLESDLSNFNNVDEITIPQEVLDAAEEISFDELEMLEEENDL